MSKSSTAQAEPVEAGFVHVPSARAALVWAIAMALAACSAPETATTPPTIVLTDTVHDVGRLQQGTPATHIFALRNTGGLDLRVDTLRTPCDCAAVASARTIAPGEEAGIEVTCDTRRAVGDLARTVTVYSNDPRQPVTGLTLVGHSIVEVAADPFDLFVGRVRRGQHAAGDVRLLTAAASPPTLGPVETQGAVVDAALVDTPAGKRIRLQIRPDAPLGGFTERVVVRTSSPRFPALEVGVTGTVVGELVVSPSKVHFGTVSANAKPTRELALFNRGDRPVRVTGVSLSPPLGQAEIHAARDGYEYRIVATLNGDAPPGRVQGMLEIRTDHPQETRISVPFSARITRR